MISILFLFFYCFYIVFILLQRRQICGLPNVDHGPEPVAHVLRPVSVYNNIYNQSLTCSGQCLLLYMLLYTVSVVICLTLVAQTFHYITPCGVAWRGCDMVWYGVVARCVHMPVYLRRCFAKTTFASVRTFWCLMLRCAPKLIESRDPCGMLVFVCWPSNPL